MKSFLITLFLLSTPLCGFAQSASDSLLENYLGKVRQQIEFKNYSTANSYLKKILSLKSTVPDEVAFRLGQTQLGLKNYVKAKEAFQKYIALAGEQGTYSLESKKLIEEADKFICTKCNNSGLEEIIDSCTICSGKGKIEVACNVCNTKGKEVCYGCKGRGVITIHNSFGVSFKTCQVCNGKGVKNCDVCMGKGRKNIFCQDCKGIGLFKRKITCNHH